MRNGQKIYDADTHIAPTAEALRPHLSTKLLGLIPDLEDRREEVKIGWAGERFEPPYRHRYRFAKREGWSKNKPRHLGEAGPRENAERHFQKFMGVTFPSYGGADDDAAARLTDMDREGVDVHFLVSSGGVGHPDAQAEMEFIAAQHRYLDGFCSHDPRRSAAGARRLGRLRSTPACRSTTHSTTRTFIRSGPRPRTTISA
jgi:hypothetical protein